MCVGKVRRTGNRARRLAKVIEARSVWKKLRDSELAAIGHLAQNRRFGGDLADEGKRTVKPASDGKGRLNVSRGNGETKLIVVTAGQGEAPVLVLVNSTGDPWPKGKSGESEYGAAGAWRE